MITGRRAYPKWLIRGLVVFAIGITVFSAVVSREHHAVENERNAAVSRYVALEAENLEQSDPALAMQLALVAYGVSQTTEARSTLIDVTAGEMPTRLSGRPGPTEIALGDDGHRVAIAHQGNNTVALYGLRYAQLTPLAVIAGPVGTAKIDAIALSDNGHLLATGDTRGRVTLWSIRSATHPRQLAVLSAGTGAVSGLGFSPRGGALAAAEPSGRVQRWSLATPAQPALASPLIAPGGAALDAVSYSHDGGTLAAVGAHGTLVIWRAHGGTTPLASTTAGDATLTAITYSPDGQTLATAGGDGAIELWRSAASGVPTRLGTTLGARGGVNALAFSRDGRYLAAGAFGKAAPVWSTSDWLQVASLPHPASVTGVAFSDGDRRLLTADAAGTATIWQFPAPSTYTFGSALAGVSYSETKPQLTVTLQSGSTDRWNIVDEWRPAPQGAWYAAPPSAASPRAYWVKTATTTTATATTTTTTTTGTGTTAAGTGTTAAGTGTTAAGTGTTAGGVPLVVNPHAGDRAMRRTQAQTNVLDSALSPNGEFFAAAGADRVVWLWDVTDPASPQLLAKLGGFTGAVTAVVFSTNSTNLFAGSADHTVHIWGLTNPTAPKELNSSPLIGPSTAITRLALSPDGRALAVATVAGHVWLWSVAQPAKARLNASLTAARGNLTALAFSPSDNVLVAGGSNHRLTFWHYRPFEAVNRICALEGTPITYAEWQLYVPGAAYKPPCAKWKPPAPLAPPAAASKP